MKVYFHYENGVLVSSRRDHPPEGDWFDAPLDEDGKEILDPEVIEIREEDVVVQEAVAEDLEKGIEAMPEQKVKHKFARVDSKKLSDKIKRLEARAAREPAGWNKLSVIARMKAKMVGT